MYLPAAHAVRPLVWTPDLVASHWRTFYMRELPPARRDRTISRHVLAVLAARAEPPARVPPLGGRDPTSARADTVPLLREMRPNPARLPLWYGTRNLLPKSWTDIVFNPETLEPDLATTTRRPDARRTAAAVIHTESSARDANR